MKKTSSVGNSITAPASGWSFSGNMSERFDEHVAKSVPDYHSMHRLILKLSDFFVRQDSLVYDIGCSTGTLTKQLGQRFEGGRDSARVIGVDIEPEMVTFATRHNRHSAVHYLASDILEVELGKSDLVILNLTAQFIPPKNRSVLVQRIWSALNWGGLSCSKRFAAVTRVFTIFFRLYTEISRRSRVFRWKKLPRRRSRCAG